MTLPLIILWRHLTNCKSKRSLSLFNSHMWCNKWHHTGPCVGRPEARLWNGEFMPQIKSNQAYHGKQKIQTFLTEFQTPYLCTHGSCATWRHMCLCQLPGFHAGQWRCESKYPRLSRGQLHHVTAMLATWRESLIRHCPRIKGRLRKPQRLTFFHRNWVRRTGSEFIPTETNSNPVRPNSIPVETNSNPDGRTWFLCRKVIPVASVPYVKYKTSYCLNSSFFWHSTPPNESIV